MLGPDLARLFVAVTLLAFASWTDWRWRRAPNLLWLVMAAAGLLILAVEWATSAGAVAERIRYLAFVPVFLVAVYAAWWLGLIAGGADAKALMGLAVLAPFPLELAAGFPVSGSPFPAAFVVLANSLLAFLAIPVALFGINAARGDFGFPAMLLGYRKEVARLTEGHDWPMERAEEGRLTFALFASRKPEDAPEQKAALEALGVKRVWVTPKIPFMIPLLLGVVLAFTVGDVLFTLLSRILA